MRGRAGHVLLAGALLIAPATLRAEVTIDRPRDFVVDRANVIDASTQRQITALAGELQAKTKAVVIVLTVPTIDGEDWFGWVQRHFDAWKLGQKGQDDGVIVALSVQDRKVRIHTGYGLEGALPDSWCGTASREAASKYFRTGNYSGGLLAITSAVAKKIAASANVTLTGVGATRRVPVKPVATCGGAFFPIMVMLIVLSSRGRRRGHYGRWGGGGLLQGLFWGSVLSNTLRGGGRSHWGGGGFGGGGFGGGGFGGGGFGGGGMSGGGGGGASW